MLPAEPDPFSRWHRVLLVLCWSSLEMRSLETETPGDDSTKPDKAFFNPAGDISTLQLVP